MIYVLMIVMIVGIWGRWVYNIPKIFINQYIVHSVISNMLTFLGINLISISFLVKTYYIPVSCNQRAVDLNHYYAHLQAVYGNNLAHKRDSLVTPTSYAALHSIECSVTRDSN